MSWEDPGAGSPMRDEEQALRKVYESYGDALSHLKPEPIPPRDAYERWKARLEFLYDGKRYRCSECDLDMEWGNWCECGQKLQAAAENPKPTGLGLYAEFFKWPTATLVDWANDTELRVVLLGTTEGPNGPSAWLVLVVPETWNTQAVGSMVLLNQDIWTLKEGD